MRPRIELLLPFWWVFVLVGVIEIAGSIAADRYESTRGKYGPVLKQAGPIAISRSGEIFVYVSNWQSSEIRVFEPDGRLSRTWPVEALQGGASIAFNSEERLEVFTWRGHRLFLFDTNGRLLRSETRSPSGTTTRVMSSFTRRATDTSGDTYEIRESEIVRLSATGTSTIVVPGPPAYLWLFFQFPFGPFVFLIHGGSVILFGMTLAEFQRRKSELLPNTPLQPTRQTAPRG